MPVSHAARFGVGLLCALSATICQADAFDASPDTSYGVNGVTPIARASGNTIVDSTLQVVYGTSTGDAYELGEYTVRPNQTYIVARYTPAGALDTNFGANGVLSLPLATPFYGTFNAIAVDEVHDYIYAAGSYPISGNASGEQLFYPIIVVRYTFDGAVDSSFNAAGFVSLSVPEQEAQITRATLTDNNTQLVLTGSDGPGNLNSTLGGGTTTQALIALLDVTGAGVPISSFGNGGIAELNLSGTCDSLYDLDVDASGNLLVAGASGPSPGGQCNLSGVLGLSSRILPLPNTDVYVLRLLPSGQLDASFATGGVFSFAENQTSVAVGGMGPLRVTTEGNISFMYPTGPGYTATTPPTFALEQLTPAGTINSNFGTNGIEQISLSNIFNLNLGPIGSLALQDDGKVLIAAGEQDTSPGGLAVVRVNGQLDALGKPPSVSLSLSASSIPVGQSSTLTWSSTDATACTATGAWTGTQRLSGSQSITPTSAGTQIYTLTCAGLGGSASAAATLIVAAATTTTGSGGGSSSSGGGGSVLPDVALVLMAMRALRDRRRSRRAQRRATLA